MPKAKRAYTGLSAYSEGFVDTFLIYDRKIFGTVFAMQLCILVKNNNCVINLKQA